MEYLFLRRSYLKKELSSSAMAIMAFLKASYHHTYIETMQNVSKGFIFIA